MYKQCYVRSTNGIITVNGDDKANGFNTIFITHPLPLASLPCGDGGASLDLKEQDWICEPGVCNTAKILCRVWPR